MQNAGSIDSSCLGQGGLLKQGLYLPWRYGCPFQCAWLLAHVDADAVPILNPAHWSWWPPWPGFWGYIGQTTSLGARKSQFEVWGRDQWGSALPVAWPGRELSKLIQRVLPPFTSSSFYFPTILYSFVWMDRHEFSQTPAGGHWMVSNHLFFKKGCNE